MNQSDSAFSTGDDVNWMYRCCDDDSVHDSQMPARGRPGSAFLDPLVCAVYKRLFFIYYICADTHNKPLRFLWYSIAYANLIKCLCVFVFIGNSWSEIIHHKTPDARAARVRMRIVFSVAPRARVIKTRGIAFVCGVWMASFFDIVEDRCPFFCFFFGRSWSRIKRIETCVATPRLGLCCCCCRRQSCGRWKWYKSRRGIIRLPHS